MNHVYEIPDDPDSFLANQDFQNARQALLMQMHLVPEPEIDADNTLVNLIKGSTPDNVFPKLRKGKKGDKSGAVVISLKGFVTEGTSSLFRASAEEGEEYKLELNSEQSKRLLRLLSGTQKVIVTQYAFAKRYQKLCVRLQERTPGTGKHDAILKRSNILIDTYNDAMSRFAKVYAHPLPEIEYLR